MGSPTTGGLSTASNCSVAGNFPACGSAAAGSVSMVAGNSSNTIQTTAVTANSQILVIEDQSLGSRLGVTCNTSALGLIQITARTAGTSFVFSISTAPTTNPGCFSYIIVN
jgi:hypothetical protein